MLYEFDHQQLATFNTGAAVLEKGSVVSDDSAVSDEQLMTRIQARDESALATLHSRHAAILRTVISRVVHHDHDVDDVIQDVLLELWNRADHYEQTKGKALGWIITLARRRAIDRIRRRQAYSRAEERARLEAETQPDLTIQHGADEDAQDADRAEIFQRILRTLPDAQREAVELAYYHGLSQREIAARTSIPLGTIKTRLELGIRKIRTAVLTMGGEGEWSLSRS